MAMVWLDHVNIRTTQLDAMVEFYEAIGLKRGKRPDFMFGGAWMYCGKQAIVHLVESEGDIKPGEAQLEHFALRASGPMRPFQQRMQKIDAPYNVISIEDINMRQVNVFDPDGNKVEVQFAATDNDDLEEFHGSKDAYKRFKKGMKLNKTKALKASKSKSMTTKTNKDLGVPAPIKDPKATTRRKKPAAKPVRAAASKPAKAAAPKTAKKPAARKAAKPKKAA